MPIEYARGLTATVRTRTDNMHLGVGLAFVAGATNGGAYLAVHQYTSHMTGIVSSMADALALREYPVFLTGLGALLSFVAGAATTAVIVNQARRRGWSSAFALPLLLEAMLLLLFGLVGPQLNRFHTVFAPATVSLLCFLMGLQNAVITKISQAEIRTTHVTGLVTDLGIELGRLLSGRRDDVASAERAVAERNRVLLLSLLLGSFFIGGVVGATAFKALGYIATVPLALVLVGLAAVPILDDVRRALR